MEVVKNFGNWAFPNYGHFTSCASKEVRFARGFCLFLGIESPAAWKSLTWIQQVALALNPSHVFQITDAQIAETVVTSDDKNYFHLFLNTVNTFAVNTAGEVASALYQAIAQTAFTGTSPRSPISFATNLCLDIDQNFWKPNPISWTLWRKFCNFNRIE